jgi:hypothetical protein
VKTSLVYKLTQGVEPKLKCPIVSGAYVITNATKISLNEWSSMPIGGSLYKTKVLFHEKKQMQRLRTVGCLYLEALLIE